MKIRLENIVKRFDDNTAVNDFSAEIESGELVTLLGPSGCGKSTMLNMLSGILYPTEGKIYFDDDDVTYVSPEKRGIGLVFQNYALYPHMTVLENICFPLEIKKVPKKERIERAKKMAESGKYDAVIALGAVIRGSTTHYDYVCNEVSKGVAQVGMQTGVPTIFGVVTTENIEQAVERAGTKAGNKGTDAAMAAMEMANLLKKIG